MAGSALSPGYYFIELTFQKKVTEAQLLSALTQMGFRDVEFDKSDDALVSGWGDSGVSGVGNSVQKAVAGVAGTLNMSGIGKLMGHVKYNARVRASVKSAPLSQSAGGLPVATLFPNQLVGVLQDNVRANGKTWSLLLVPMGSGTAKTFFAETRLMSQTDDAGNTVIGNDPEGAQVGMQMLVTGGGHLGGAGSPAPGRPAPTPMHSIGRNRSAPPTGLPSGVPGIRPFGALSPAPAAGRGFALASSNMAALLAPPVALKQLTGGPVHSVGRIGPVGSPTQRTGILGRGLGLAGLGLGGGVGVINNTGMTGGPATVADPNALAQQAQQGVTQAQQTSTAVATTDPNAVDTTPQAYTPPTLDPSQQQGGYDPSTNNYGQSGVPDGSGGGSSSDGSGGGSDGGSGGFDNSSNNFGQGHLPGQDSSQTSQTMSQHFDPSEGLSTLGASAIQALFGAADAVLKSTGSAAALPAQLQPVLSVPLQERWRRYKDWGSPFATAAGQLGASVEAAKNAASGTATTPSAQSSMGAEDIIDTTRFRFVGELTKAISAMNRSDMTWTMVRRLALSPFKDADFQLKPFSLQRGGLYEFRFFSRQKAMPTKESVLDALAKMGFSPMKAILMKKNVRIPRRSATLSMWYGVGQWSVGSSVTNTEDPFFFESMAKVNP